MREQELLLRSLQQCDFMLYELQLYLDTHPNCKRAMEQYRKHLEMKQKAEKMGQEYSGIEIAAPIAEALVSPADNEAYAWLRATVSQTNTTERWNWVDAPWPWEKEANCDVDV